MAKRGSEEQEVQGEDEVKESTHRRKIQENVIVVALRVPSDMLSQVDEMLKRKPIRMPRNMWILEAILEKLDREPISKTSMGT